MNQFVVTVVEIETSPELAELPGVAPIERYKQTVVAIDLLLFLILV